VPVKIIALPLMETGSRLACWTACKNFGTGDFIVARTMEKATFSVCLVTADVERLRSRVCLGTRLVANFPGAKIVTDDQTGSKYWFDLAEA
jgi:hypothetical protein